MIKVSYFAAVVLSFIPWGLCGAAVLYCTNCPSLEQRIRAFAIGAFLSGPAIGAIFLTAAFLSLARINILVLWASLAGLIFLIMRAMISGGFLGVRKIGTNFREPEIVPWVIALLLYSAFIVVTQSLVVMQGWDALGHWGETAVYFSNLQAMEATEFNYDKRHPPLLPAITQYFAWIGQLVDAAGAASYIFWSQAFVSFMLLIYSSALEAGNNRSVALLLAMLPGSLPLWENHLLLFGYADLIQGVALAFIFATLQLPSNNKSIWYFLFTCCAVTAFSLKNTSPLFVSLLMVALALCSRRAQLILIPIAILALVLAVYLLVLGHEVSFLGEPIRYVAHGNKLVVFGKKLVFVNTQLLDIVENFKFAYFINQSFSLAMIAIFLVGVSILARWSSAGSHRKSLLIFTAAGVGMLAAAQFSEYGFVHATPGNDTGFSRFSLFIIPTAYLLLVESTGDWLWQRS